MASKARPMARPKGESSDDPSGFDGRFATRGILMMRRSLVFAGGLIVLAGPASAADYSQEIYSPYPISGYVDLHGGRDRGNDSGFDNINGPHHDAWHGPVFRGSGSVAGLSPNMSVRADAWTNLVKVPEPIFNEAAAKDFPQTIYDKITAKITYETTFAQFSPNGLIRWWTRTIKLIDFVKAPSPTYEDTYLYAMRYVVSVISDKDSLAVYGTSCQVVVVYKDKQFDEPTVVCEPVNLDQPEHQS
jgi:hypothetical protein